MTKRPEASLRDACTRRRQRRRGRVMLCWMALAGWLCLPGGEPGALAQETAPRIGDHRGMVLVLPGGDEEYARALAQARGDAREPARVRVDSPSFSNLIRILAREKGREPLEACATDRQAFVGLVEQLETLLLKPELELAEQRRREAVEAFRCEARPVSRATIARFVLASGVLQTLQTGSDNGRFREALTIDPTLAPPTRYSPQVQAVFERSRQDLASLARLTVRFEQSSLQGVQLWVDGVLVEGTEASLYVGRHFFQVALPDGRVLAGLLRTLSPRTVEGGEQARQWILPDDALVLDPVDKVPGYFSSLLSAEQLSPELARAWKLWLSLYKTPWWLVCGADSTSSSRCVYLFPDGRVEKAVLAEKVEEASVEPLAEPPPPVIPQKKPEWWELPRTWAVGTALSGISWGLLFKAGCPGGVDHLGVGGVYCAEPAPDVMPSHAPAGVIVAGSGMAALSTLVCASGLTWTLLDQNQRQKQSQNPTTPLEKSPEPAATPGARLELRLEPLPGGFLTSFQGQF